MGTSLEPAGLTEKQAAYVEYVAKGLAPTDAARAAGFQFPAQEGARLARSPHVVAALQRATARIFREELVPKAIGRLRSLLEDKATPAPALIKAIDTTLKRGGVVAEDASGRSKPLSEKGIDELEDLVSRLQTALAAHEAKTIDAVARDVTVIEDPLDKLLD